ncbi:hypothetical protein DFP72DRAFT_906319 [Ephemerocybe angulata]|uniref:DUF6533 domain-containing protein n=1 Tax=Ephemerocybe angulata TaxID=980116 RepID=A0A8H6HS94_9AGAR|nr:hypothetical protein DFP72DRAFT_906319 [Tulosesus angulatus]
MSAPSEELARLIVLVCELITQSYISLAFHFFYVYYFATTLIEEVITMWPHQWMAGKILFFVMRYGPLLRIVQMALLETRFYLIFTPKTCSSLFISSFATHMVYTYATEAALLICIHALLGSKRKYLVLLGIAYAVPTACILRSQSIWIKEFSRARTIDLLDVELGYSCTWAGALDAQVIQADRVIKYVSVAKASCTAVLALAVYYKRYRGRTGKLIRSEISGIYFVLTMIETSRPGLSYITKVYVNYPKLQ